jgi:transcriptional regulator with XRE-family HTH domain
MRIPLTKEIKLLLIQQDLDITSLADELGHHRQYISGIINGRQRSAGVQRSIAARLGVELDDIFPVAEPARAHKAA